MPSFFQFTQGTESSRVRPNDTAPLLGRFRAVPPHPGVAQRRRSQLGLFAASAGADRGSVHIGHGYGSLFAAQLAGENDGDADDDDLDDERSVWERAWQRWIVDLWVNPRQSAVKGVLHKWWSRYGFLVLMPALLAVAWCSVPIPQYAFPDEEVDDDGNPDSREPRAPGHGASRVQINFWFFLFVYYGFYNLTALVWITKLFNLYSLNWWPKSLGFPFTISLIAILSISLPIPIYAIPSTRFLTVHNTVWVSGTFITMAMPVAVAFFILTTNERHVGLRHSLSETQRLFTTSWWTGEPEPVSSRRDQRRRRHHIAENLDDPDVSQLSNDSPPPSARMQRSWLPASFVRFLWFCVALSVGLMAYVLGEAYAEIYLRTLPHNSFETVVYVYGWVITVHLLDALTGWVLGIREGERVGSYPLSWVFKLYFMLTYQTYVRALYARLRSPAQFVILQILSSTGLVIITPIMMTRFVHKILNVIGLNGQSYDSYQKLQTRNVFIRFLAENVSMATFLGSVLVLHYGANKDVYPYFAFDGGNDEGYDFNLTFRASSVTWACELVASLAVRGLIRLCFGVDVGLEGKLDLAVWPELLPTCVVVMLHVMQNMLFSIVRLQFR